MFRASTERELECLLQAQGRLPSPFEADPEATDPEVEAKRRTTQLIDDSRSGMLEVCACAIVEAYGIRDSPSHLNCPHLCPESAHRMAGFFAQLTLSHGCPIIIPDPWHVRPNRMAP